MELLFIGGTGTISAAISRRALELGWELWHLNRGNRSPESWNAGPGKFHQINCDISNEAEAAGKLSGLEFDLVADFIAFTPDQVQRDYRLFKGKTRQYIFISSASAYQKPLASCYVSEATPLSNPYWEYSRQKIACEEFLLNVYREEGFPITIVRPSHTYDERKVPLGVHGKKGSWQVLKRIIDGKPVIIHGDGTSLWTMTAAPDFARAFTGLAGNIHALGEAVQITSDETICWNQIYQAIADALGKPLKAVHVSSEFLAQAAPDYDYTGGLIGDKAVSVIFDNTKLKRLVPGFSAQIRFDQGIRETINHVLAHPELQVEDHDFDAFCDRVIVARERALKDVLNI
uniref:NAD-dependent epimerase/dehydratase n=1 Tax=uncultured bacterium contig00062 TaxID=1181545 RepID=A0A806K1N8_9BACT|nr:NAD-dependent epimerase/dehydratase [uncultured bacterium contig00062]